MNKIAKTFAVEGAGREGGAGPVGARGVSRPRGRHVLSRSHVLQGHRETQRRRSRLRMVSEN